MTVRNIIDFDVNAPCVVRSSGNLVRIMQDKSLMSSIRDFNYISVFSSDRQCKYIFMVPRMNSARQELDVGTRKNSRCVSLRSQIAKFMGPIWGPPGSCRPQMGPMLTTWTLLSGMYTLPMYVSHRTCSSCDKRYDQRILCPGKHRTHTVETTPSCVCIVYLIVQGGWRYNRHPIEGTES